jgi:hypothetical protein
MQPKMHWSVYGNAFAAAIDRQKTLIRRTRNELDAGATFSSAAIFSALAVPVTQEIISSLPWNMTCHNIQIQIEQNNQGLWWHKTTNLITEKGREACTRVCVWMCATSKWWACWCRSIQSETFVVCNYASMEEVARWYAYLWKVGNWEFNNRPGRHENRHLNSNDVSPI